MDTPACASSGPVPGLDGVQARNARSIVATVSQVAAHHDQIGAQDEAALVALIAAQQESGIRLLANSNVPESLRLPHDGVGADHDSVGLFQQRASWGWLTQRMDATASTRLFAERLVAITGWSVLPPGEAAQLVQVSAAPGEYARWEPTAQQWLAAILATTTCDNDGIPKSAVGSTPPGTIPAGYQVPESATTPERIAVTFALAQLGKPYVFAAAGPDAYDCSGLTMAAWAAAGVQLPHWTGTQILAGTPVASPSLLSPGDLILIPGSDGTLVAPRHVGLYLGEGYVIEAPQTGDVVKIVPLTKFGPIAGMRHLK